jgi:hypothetical protein
MRRLALLLLLAVSLHADDRLGTIRFPNSGKPEAQPAFLRGVLLLHNFAYPQAASAFVEAQKIDPNFALAYWGEAMTYNHPLWNQFDLERGRAVLQRLAPLKAAATPREREYVDAVEALYSGAERGARDRAYEAAMERLARDHPDDAEAQAFSALAILGARGWHRVDERRSVRAAAILEELLPTHIDHPGVLHYLIHAYDDPVHAPLGLRAARRYANVAAGAPHALHMPSHIFLQLGMWDEAARSNEAAYALSKQWGAPDMHSLIWLQYAYLQQRRYDDARRLLAEVKPGEHDEHHASARDTMQLRYAVETRQWNDFVFTRGAGRALQAIAAKQYADAQRFIDEAAASKDDYAATETAELRALLDSARGNVDAALQHAKEAVTAEGRADEATIVSGPPDNFKPANELYGELLLQAGRPKEALEQFRASLLRMPNRAASVAGAKAAEAALH